MMQETVFGGAIGFMARLGVFDVILPFLLIFTLLFAILEKTKAFGLDEVEGKKYTRKNLNAIVAFTSAFLVVASSYLVNFLNKFIMGMVIILLVAVFFLIVSGSFQEETDKGWFLSKGWNGAFIGLCLLGTLLVLLNALSIPSTGEPLLSYVFGFLGGINLSSTASSSILLILVIVGFIFWITGDKKPAKEKKEDDS